MGRRTDIDWEAIERDYRAGLLSILAIADKHKVSDPHLRARAKKYGWARDLSAAIKARTAAKISTIDVEELIEQSARESAGKSAATIKLAVEQASDVAAGVIIRHRKSFRDQVARAASIERLFDELLAAAATPAARSADDDDVAPALDIHKAASAFKALVDSRAKLVALERESFGIAGLDAPDARDVDEMPASDAWKVCSDGLG